MGVSNFLRKRYLRKLYNAGCQDGLGAAAAKNDKKAYMAGREAAEGGKSIDLGWSELEIEFDGGGVDDVGDDEVEEDMEEDEEYYEHCDEEDEDDDDDDEDADDDDDDEDDE